MKENEVDLTLGDLCHVPCGHRKQFGDTGQWSQVLYLDILHTSGLT